MPIRRHLPLLLFCFTCLACDPTGFEQEPGAPPEAAIPEGGPYYFRAELPNGDTIRYDEAYVLHNPPSNVYYITAPVALCDTSLVVGDSTGILPPFYIFYVPEPLGATAPVQVGWISEVPLEGRPTTAYAGLGTFPCDSVPATLIEAPSVATEMRGTFSGDLYEDLTGKFTQDCANLVNIGAVTFEFYAPIVNSCN